MVEMILNEMARMAWQRARWEDAEQSALTVPDTFRAHESPIQ